MGSRVLSISAGVLLVTAQASGVGCESANERRAGCAQVAAGGAWERAITSSTKGYGVNGATQNLHPDLVAVMGRIEARLKRSLTINSGYRDPQHNHDVGGVENSEHTYDPAEGVDVDCQNGSSCDQIVRAAMAEGIVRIGIGRNFVHIGISKDKPQNVIWNYYQKEKKV